MNKVYCHNATKYSAFPCTFTKGNWYNVADYKLNFGTGYYRIIDDNNYLISFWKNIDKRSSNEFSDVFYTEQEYRNKQLDKLLNE